MVRKVFYYLCSAISSLLILLVAALLLLNSSKDLGMLFVLLPILLLIGILSNVIALILRHISPKMTDTFSYRMYIINVVILLIGLGTAVYIFMN